MQITVDPLTGLPVFHPDPPRSGGGSVGGGISEARVIELIEIYANDDISGGMDNLLFTNDTNLLLTSGAEDVLLVT